MQTCAREGRGQACLDGGVADGSLSAVFAGRHSIPRYRGGEPELRRAKALERFLVRWVGWPVPGPVGPVCGSALAFQLPRWIHEMDLAKGSRNKAALTGITLSRAVHFCGRGRLTGSGLTEPHLTWVQTVRRDMACPRSITDPPLNLRGWLATRPADFLSDRPSKSHIHPCTKGEGSADTSTRGRIHS